MDLLVMKHRPDDVHRSCPALFTQEWVSPVFSLYPLVDLGYQEQVLITVNQAAHRLDVVFSLGHEDALETVQDVQQGFPDVRFRPGRHGQGLGDGGRHERQGCHVHQAVLISDHLHSFGLLERQGQYSTVGNLTDDVQAVSQFLFLKADSSCSRRSNHYSMHIV